jgi:serine/threonine protein kinase
MESSSSASQRRTTSISIDTASITASAATSPTNRQHTRCASAFFSKSPSRYPSEEHAYELREPIGSGSFATVYAATLRSTGESLAIKVQSLERHEWETMRHEITTMAIMNHPNLVRILASFTVGTNLWAVMPRFELGSCAHILKASLPLGIKDEWVLATILRNVLEALIYLHQDGCMHRDIKAGNILVSCAGQVQLADFGVACRSLDPTLRNNKHTTLAGSPLWLAPEVIEGDDAQGYDERADIWSLGITALELAFGHPPHANCTPLKAMMLICSSDAPTIANTRRYVADRTHTFSSEFSSFISACLVKDPRMRSNAKQLLQHKFFAKVVTGTAESQRQLLVERLFTALPASSIISLTSPTTTTTRRGGASNKEKEEEDASNKEVAETSYTCTSPSDWSWAITNMCGNDGDACSGSREVQ